MLESLSCNRGDPPCRRIHLGQEDPWLGGDGRKSVLLYLCVLAHSRRVWMQICFIKVSGIRRGPNTFKCRRRCWRANVGYGETHQLRPSQGLSCFHPKRKRRASETRRYLPSFFCLLIFFKIRIRRIPPPLLIRYPDLRERKY